MAKHWLAVIRDSDFIVARIAVRKNKEPKILFIARYEGRMPRAADTDELVKQELGELKKWLVRLNVPLKKLKIAISSQGLISRVIDLPKIANDDLDKLMTNNIDQYFTIDVSNYLIDYRILSKYMENEKQMIKVLLAAFPMERMKFILGICQQLGFEPEIVDLTADCVARTYGYLANSKKINGDMAIVSLNSDKVEFVLLKDGEFFLYSDMEMDTRSLIERYENGSPNIKEDFTDLLIAVNKLPENEIMVLNEEVELYQQTEEEISNLSLDESHTIMITAEAADIDIDMDMHGEQDTDMEMLIGLDETRVNVINSGDEDFTQLKMDDEENEFFKNVFKQAALNATRQEISEKEFLLEDLFVPLEKLEGNLAFTKLDRTSDDFSTFNHPADNNCNIYDTDKTDNIVIHKHPKESEFSYDVQDNDIFDTLDLSTTMIGIEELTDRGQDMGPRERLENGFSPVLTNLSDLLSFFAARNSGHPVSTIYLTGDHSIHPYIVECFQESLGINTVAGFPNGWQPLNVKAAKDVAKDWQKYACLYGLALRED